MSERNPLPHSINADRQATWDPAVLAAALDASVEPTRDLALGSGYRLTLASQPTHLAIYPAHGAAQLNAHDAQLAIIVAGSEPPIVSRHGVVFEHAERSLTVMASGEILLVVLPESVREATRATGTAADASDDSWTQDDLETAVLDDPAPSQAPATPSSETVDADIDSERERVRLVGRLGAAPRFRTTRNDVLIGSFPLAVREDDDSTSWHTVRAFRERAVKLREAGLTKGQIAEVIGYRHTHEQQTRDGETTLVEEVYAVVVKPR